jgi:hypothetical protein
MSGERELKGNTPLSIVYLQETGSKERRKKGKKEGRKK